jgi:hypothetical protein
LGCLEGYGAACCLCVSWGALGVPLERLSGSVGGLLSLVWLGLNLEVCCGYVLNVSWGLTRGWSLAVNQLGLLIVYLSSRLIDTPTTLIDILSCSCLRCQSEEKEG